MEFQDSGIPSESKKASFFTLKEDHVQPNVYHVRSTLSTDYSACSRKALNCPLSVPGPPAEQMEPNDNFFSLQTHPKVWSPLSASPLLQGAQHHVSEPAGGVNLSSYNRSDKYRISRKETHAQLISDVNPTLYAKYHTKKSGNAIQGKPATSSPAKPPSGDLLMQFIPSRSEDTPMKRKAVSPSNSLAPPQKRLFAPMTSLSSAMRDPSTDLRSTQLSNFFMPGGLNPSIYNKSDKYSTGQQEALSAEYFTKKPGNAIQEKIASFNPAKLPSGVLLMEPSPSRSEGTHKKRKAVSPSKSSASPQKRFSPITSPSSTMKNPSTDLRSTQLTNFFSESVPWKKTPEICLSYIWKHCKFGDTCTNMHYHLPYRWQVCNGSEWEDLPDMEDIEKAYSEPGNDSFQKVNFQTMTTNANPVRRLSTPSSVTQPPEYVLTTEWIWYWKDEFGIWIEYGHLSMKNERASVVSSDLEKIYLLNPTGIIPFTAKTNDYVINCQEMKQKNTLFNTEREICRRPKFLDYKNVQILKGCTKSTIRSYKEKPSDSLLNTGTYPPTWDMKGMPESGYKKVCIPESSDEYLKIITMFKKTVPGYTVKKLWQIQNSFLWKAYQLQKEKMKTRNSGTNIYEQQLFHGTGSANIDAICSENFDWRVCGANATAYGQGSYFARDASFSDIYSVPNSSGMRMMIVARVLVGDFVEGNSTMKLPPQKPNSSQRYDSCVNTVHDPSIFVVFDKLQVYPEYILEYKDRNDELY